MDYIEFTAQYQAQLNDLTFNSKPLINTLTMLASENIPAATSIQGVIERQILRGPQACKLPSLYLLDSIVKNVGKPYTALFSRNLPEVFKAVWQSLPPAQRPALQKVLKHWDGFFPAEVVRAAAQVTIPPPQQLAKPILDPRLAPHPGIIPAVQPLAQPAQPIAQPGPSALQDVFPPQQQVPYQQAAPGQPMQTYQQIPAQYAGAHGPAYPPAAQVHYPPAAPQGFPGQPTAAPAFAPHVPAPVGQVPLPAPGPQVLPHTAVPAAQIQFAPGYAGQTPQAEAMPPAYQQQPGGLPMPPQQLHTSVPVSAPYLAPAAPTNGPASLHQHQPPVPQLQVPAPPPSTAPPAPPQNAGLDIELPAFLNELLAAGAITLPGAAGGEAVPPPRSNNQRRGARGKAQPKPRPAILKPSAAWQASLPEDDPRRSKKVNWGAIAHMKAVCEKRRIDNLDREFQERRRRKLNAGKPKSRQWFVPLDCWMAGMYADPDAPVDFFGDEKPKVVEKKVYSEEADDDQTHCIISGEKFEEYYDEDREQWRYKDAVKVDAAQAKRLKVKVGTLVKSGCLPTTPDPPPAKKASQALRRIVSPPTATSPTIVKAPSPAKSPAHAAVARASPAPSIKPDPSPPAAPSFKSDPSPPAAAAIKPDPSPAPADAAPGRAPTPPKAVAPTPVPADVATSSGAPVGPAAAAAGVPGGAPADAAGATAGTLGGPSGAAQIAGSAAQPADEEMKDAELPTRATPPRSRSPASKRAREADPAWNATLLAAKRIKVEPQC